ncbi:MAG: 30S ribosomal protein S4 [Candidatus Latescibacterota bacterium]|nr:MAG: 30S ribosomal protein S4 [Candidatus Latescibacterota bacterium]
MARYTGPSCRLCRREGMKLFLKGERCVSPACSFERRGFPPGQHGRTAQQKLTTYGLQLREKQKLKRIYGVLETQFKRYLEMAERMPGNTGENLLQILERRLDNVVYRLGFAPSRKAARQLVAHGHFLVNERKVDIPSYLVSPGDVVRVRDESRDLAIIHASLRRARGRELPWLQLDKSKLSGTVVEVPKREDIPTPVQERLVVEFYSR